MRYWKWSVLSSFFLVMTARGAEACSGGYGHGGSKVVFLLLAVAAGYWVLTLSDKQKKPLDRLGRIIGSLILIVSVVGLLCVATCRVLSYVKGPCAGISCPFGPKGPAPKTPSSNQQGNP